MNSASLCSSLVLVVICIAYHAYAFNVCYNRRVLKLKQSILKLGDGDAYLNNEVDNEICDDGEDNCSLDLLVEDKMDVVQVREEDLQQYRDLGTHSLCQCSLTCFTCLFMLDLILTERAKRFHDPKLVGVEKEKCILVAVGNHLLI